MIRYIDSIVDSEHWGDNWKAGTDKYTLKEFVAYLDEFMKLNKIPFCDLYNTLGWNERNQTAYFGADKTHPLNVGYESMAKRMNAFMVSHLY